MWQAVLAAVFLVLELCRVAGQTLSLDADNLEHGDIIVLIGEAVPEDLVMLAIQVVAQMRYLLEL